MSLSEQAPRLVLESDYSDVPFFPMLSYEITLGSQIPSLAGTRMSADGPELKISLSSVTMLRSRMNCMSMELLFYLTRLFRVASRNLGLSCVSPLPFFLG